MPAWATGGSVPERGSGSLRLHRSLEDWSPAPSIAIKWLSIPCISGSRASRALCWPPWAPAFTPPYIQTPMSDSEVQCTWMEVRVTAKMQATCRDCLNRNGSHHSRLGRQGKASKAQLRSVVGLETGKGGGKEPWRSQASKKVKNHFFNIHTEP